MKKKPSYVVAITGASGVLYGLRLVKALLAGPNHLILMVSKAGFKVLAYETAYQNGMELLYFLEQSGISFHKESSLDILESDDIAASPASGSFVHSGMAIAPCSMKTLAKVAGGIADDLIVRSADVCLKEKRPLILLPRESPLNLIHLENMTRALKAGATIMPPNPSFYAMPDSIETLADGVVARVLDHLGVDHDMGLRWQA